MIQIIGLIRSERRPPLEILGRLSNSSSHSKNTGILSGVSLALTMLSFCVFYLVAIYSFLGMVTTLFIQIGT